MQPHRDLNNPADVVRVGLLAAQFNEHAARLIGNLQLSPDDKLTLSTKNAEASSRTAYAKQARDAANAHAAQYPAPADREIKRQAERLRTNIAEADLTAARCHISLANEYAQSAIKSDSLILQSIFVNIVPAQIRTPENRRVLMDENAQYFARLCADTTHSAYPLRLGHNSDNAPGRNL